MNTTDPTTQSILNTFEILEIIAMATSLGLMLKHAQNNPPPKEAKCLLEGARTSLEKLLSAMPQYARTHIELGLKTLDAQYVNGHNPKSFLM